MNINSEAIQMDIKSITDEQLKVKIDLVEKLIAKERDWRNLPTLNNMFERLIDEQVRRENVAALEEAYRIKDEHQQN